MSIELVPGPLNAITDVPGIEVGHETHQSVMRGVTAVLCKAGATGGVSVRGGNPGTFNTDALSPTTVGSVVHGIGLVGGSLFGLAAIPGMTEWLYEHGHGFRFGDVLIPVMAGAVIFDLFFADATVHPAANWGYRAAAAATNGPFARGNAGAGAGGTAGKGPGCVKTKGGLGTASLELPGGVVVGAIVVINSLGGLIHPVDGRVYAAEGGYDRPLRYHATDRSLDAEQVPQNTTIGVVATNASLPKAQMAKVADMAHNGFARAIRPMHTTLDGDTIFALSTHVEPRTLPGTTESALTDLVGEAAADAMVLACLDAADQAEGVPGWPSMSEARAAFGRS